MPALLPVKARNAVHTQHLVNRVVEATSPDCIELLTKHVFQSIFEVGTVAASIVLGQRENNDVQKAVTLCTSTGRHNLANCNPAKITNVLRLQQLGKYFAKLVGPFSLGGPLGVTTTMRWKPPPPPP